MSTTNTILLLGKNGQVGWELQRSLAPLGQVIALDRHSTDYCGDLADHAGIRATVQRLAPSIIVNAAAYTAVDKAESEPAQATAINETAVAALAEEAAALKALVVHYSTDYVFDGSGNSPWREDDATGPLNTYGKSKLAGEQALVNSGCEYLIFRTSWVYAARGSNFIKTILRLAAEREELTIIDDQWGAPTGAELIADISAHAIRATVADPARGGTYHLAAGGTTSWHGYAKVIVAAAREAGVELKTTLEKILPVTSSSFKTAAQRPLNSRLSTDKLQTAFGLQMPDWEFGVRRMLTEILESENLERR